VNVKITERTQKAVASASQGSSTETSNELGLEIEKVPSSMAGKLELKEGEGLLVKDLTPDGAGSKIGLRPGDVILEVDGVAINDVAVFNKAVVEAKKNKIIRLKVQRNNGKIFLAGSLG